MSYRQPSTPPPSKDESINPFFTTPQLKNHEKTSTNEYNNNGRRISSNEFNKNNFNNFNQNKLSIDYKNYQNNSVLFTPTTPYVNNNGNNDNEDLLPLSPQTNTKKGNHHMIDNINKNKQKVHLLRTPEATPRHHHRKRDTIESIYFDSNTHNGNYNKLFGVNNVNNVGTGRNFGSCINEHENEHHNNENRKMGILEFRNSIKIQVEEDEEDEEEEEEEEEDEEQIKEQRLMNYASSECDSDEELRERQSLELQSKMNIVNNNKSICPSTPPRQIINDEYIRHQHGVERCEFPELLDFNDTNKDLNLLKRKKFDNPFIGSRKRSNKGLIEEEYSKFEKGIELVYHPTGEKFFIESNFNGEDLMKPKKLEFEEIGKEDLLHTPTMTNRHKMSIRGLLNNERDNEEEEDVELKGLGLKGSSGSSGSGDSDNRKGSIIISEGVKYEKVKNPFQLGIEERNKRSEDETRKEVKEIKDIKEIEYVNHRTGEHFKESMDEEQLRIKPKKLRFD